MKIYFLLIYEFFKVGLFSIGGGLATIPFLKEIADKYDWYTPEMLTDMIAVSESTPGPIGVNMATYAGYSAAGIPGAVISTLSLIAPSITIICIVSKFLRKFRDSNAVNDVFYGLRAATTGLIAGAMFEVFLISLIKVKLIGTGSPIGDIINLPSIVLFFTVIIMSAKLKRTQPLYFIILGAAVGIIFKL